MGTAFPHLFLAWEHVPTPFCTSNFTSRCGIQTITLKHGYDLTDGQATRRFALLVNSLHSETKRSSVEILVGECSLYSNYLVQLFSFHSAFLFGNGVPTPLFLALHPWLGTINIGSFIRSNTANLSMPFSQT